MNKIIWVLILSVLIVCSGCVTNMDASVNEQIKIAIYPSGSLSETYYFVLNADGELITEKGTRIGNDMTQSPFIIKDSVYDYKSEKKQLSSSEISKIIDLANKVHDGGFSTNDTIIKDSWDIQILYKNKTIKQNYFDDIPPQVKDLVDEFINISAIEVDLHGWA